MEFSNGQSLNSAIKGYLTRKQTSTIISGIAKGLDYLHDNHGSLERPLIFHADIKSQNIVLDPQFNPKIIDFGISKILTSRDPEIAKTEMFKATGGTPTHWPPEAFNTPYQINFNADYWAFGVVCYEIFAKALPFEAKGEKHEIMRIVLIKPLINNRSYGPEFQTLNDQQRALIANFFHSDITQRAVKMSDIEKLIP